MFVLSPLLLLPLFHQPKLGLLLLAGVYLTSTVVKTADAIIKQIHPDVFLSEGPRGDRRLSTAHMNTIYRAATFAIGLAVGYLILEVRSGKMKVNLSKPVVWLCWLLSLSFLVTTLWFSTLFIRPSYEDTPWLSAVYLGLIQRLWVLGAAWIVLACTMGYGGWLGKMLSWSGFVPLSRLSFGIYLFHMNIQSHHVFRMRQPFNMDAFDIVFHCVGDYVMSAGLATVLYLTVEAPCSRVINHLLWPTSQYARRAETPGDHQEKKKNT
ncbi:hypothetical protein J6590_048321 [Homalodisca vitripennis]|nr:hypothetical protein J6590_048321 [Homalodisca vitripennis]